MDARLEIGKWNKLKVVKRVDFGVYLDGLEFGEILMPNRYVPADCKIGDEVEVFVYLDSEDRIVATTEKPYGLVGDFVLLEVVSVSRMGAFLNWGLMKDLLVPFVEQNQKMEEGRSYVVHIYLDDMSNRIVGSARVEDFLNKTAPEFKEGDEVDLTIYTQTDLGYKAIINTTHTGILYANEVFKQLERGDKMKGYIKKIREDGKIDLRLDKPGYEKVTDISTQIIDKLKEHKGFIELVDKSPADEIYNMFGVSKKTFKKAIGGLYKARLISIEEKGIRLSGNSKN
ncbi:MAG TPA: S1-like domain-containing RNA-binding protein [Bacteroidia bacterium]|jgi:predicted RNA-binding protein (virulence factor B family)|nr:S1-like domain-containing RNA-binding protein [Bacteroidia bacterium]